MYVGLHVKYPLFLSLFIKLEFSRQIFKNYAKINFHENPSSGSPVVPCGNTYGSTGGHGEANIRFPRFANAPRHNGDKSKLYL